MFDEDNGQVFAQVLSKNSLRGFIKLVSRLGQLDEVASQLTRFDARFNMGLMISPSNSHAVGEESYIKYIGAF